MIHLESILIIIFIMADNFDTTQLIGNENHITFYYWAYIIGDEYLETPGSPLHQDLVTSDPQANQEALHWIHSHLDHEPLVLLEWENSAFWLWWLLEYIYGRPLNPPSEAFTAVLKEWRESRDIYGLRMLHILLLKAKKVSYSLFSCFYSTNIAIGSSGDSSKQG